MFYALKLLIQDIKNACIHDSDQNSLKSSVTLFQNKDKN